MSVVSETQKKPVTRPISRGRAFRKSRIGRLLFRSPFYFLVALIFRTLDALRVFDLPYVLTGGQNGTSTLSTIAQEAFAANRLYGLGAAMAVLTFIVVMIVSFSYIRFVGGNLRGMGDD